MTKQVSLIFMLMISTVSWSQTLTENFIQTTTYQVETQDGVTKANGGTLSSNNKIETITYYDGLGRPKQIIQKQAGGNGEDLIVPIAYDDFGRQEFEYLPYARSGTPSLDFETMNSTLYGNLETQYANKYQEDRISTSQNTINAYSETVFEASPLNRVLKQGAPGADWAVNDGGSDHTIKFEYGTNGFEEVKLYDVEFLDTKHEVPILTYNDFYEAGALYKTITKDENWVSGKNHTTEEFKDKQGRVILKRTYNGSIAHDTQYVYDKFGNLTYVLSPKGSDVVMRKNTFNDFTMEVDALSLIRPGSDVLTDPDFMATGSATITLVGNQLSIDIDVQYNNLVTLSSYGTETMLKPVPNVKLGEFDSGGGVGSYIVSIKEGALSVRGTGIVSSVTENFTITLPEYSPDPEIIDDLCYQYVYDHRNRLVEKKIPGKGWEHIIYDKLDRPVMTQDANLRNNGNDWLFTKYDAFGRVVYTGKYDYSYNQSTSEGLTQRELLQSEFNSQSQFSETKQGSYTTQNGVKLYYSNTVLPVSNIELFTINYYDEYTDLPTGLGTTVSSYGVTSSTKTKGLGTVNKVRVLGTTQWITNVVYYNEKAQTIYTHNSNPFLGTTDVIKNDLDFLGKIKQANKTHTSSLGSITVVDTYWYDHMGRLKEQQQEGLKNGQELICYNNYDQFGQLIQKAVGGQSYSGIQDISYSYNIRGWLTGINELDDGLGDDLFAFKINYNNLDNVTSSSEALYNGNISETIWNTKTVDPDTWRSEIPRGYSYVYDGLNRIGEAYFTDYESLNYYDYFSFYDYDKNGNVLVLARYGENEVELDALDYFYDGNQLESVEDYSLNPKGFGNEESNQEYSNYIYDANGNLVYDEIKEIYEIQYNHLNLPEFVLIGSYFSGVEYFYDANGVKQRKYVLNEEGDITITDYAGDFIYVEENNAKKIAFMSHPEGYAEPQNGIDFSGDFDYVYQYKDHLGNVRLSYADRDSDQQIAVTSDPFLTEIIEESNYYPFGLEHKGYNNVVNGVENNYFNFNGKELDESLGLNVIEMDFRQYDPALGRFNVVDAMAEERNWLSPYNFVQNNPIMRVDPTGLLDDYGLDQDGNIELIKKTDDKTDTLYSVTRGEDGELVKDDNGEVVRNDTNGDGEVADGDSVTVNKGILNKKKTNTVEASNGKEYTFDQFNITGDSQAQSLFEFVGANSNVEWSLTGVGSKNGAQGSNILTTSHIENSEIGGGYLFAYGYSIRFSNHSHPYSNNASRADRNFAKTVNTKFPNARTRILHKGSYTLYDEKGSIKPIQIKPAPIAPLKPFKN